jgi:alpha-ketoglutarate-dependent taurine dioxygenase
MDIAPLGAGFGAELRGVTLADVASDDAAYAAVRAAFEEHSVLVWRKGDVVMWDNRATMHRGRPWPAHEARLMIRTTISATEADGVDTMRPPSSQAAE